MIEAGAECDHVFGGGVFPVNPIRETHKYERQADIKITSITAHED